MTRSRYDLDLDGSQQHEARLRRIRHLAWEVFLTLIACGMWLIIVGFVVASWR